MHCSAFEHGKYSSFPLRSLHAWQLKHVLQKACLKMTLNSELSILVPHQVHFESHGLGLGIDAERGAIGSKTKVDGGTLGSVFRLA